MATGNEIFVPGLPITAGNPCYICVSRGQNFDALHTILVGTDKTTLPECNGQTFTLSTTCPDPTILVGKWAGTNPVVKTFGGTREVDVTITVKDKNGNTVVGPVIITVVVVAVGDIPP